MTCSKLIQMTRHLYLKEMIIFWSIDFYIGAMTFSIMTLSIKGLFSTLCINNIQHSITTLGIMLSVVMESVISCYNECCYVECHNAECHYAKCHYAEYHYAECRYVECCSAFSTTITNNQIFSKA
jgi:hypothetical protein